MKCFFQLVAMTCLVGLSSPMAFSQEVDLKYLVCRVSEEPMKGGESSQFAVKGEVSEYPGQKVKRAFIHFDGKTLPDFSMDLTLCLKCIGQKQDMIEIQISHKNGTTSYSNGIALSRQMAIGYLTVNEQTISVVCEGTPSLASGQ